MVGDRRGLACALVAVAVLALSACTSGEAGPEPSSSATTAATAPTAPTPSPSESAVPKPERPADMDRTDEAGAAAAARYFVALYPYVLSTGDVGDWETMSSDACSFCKGIAQDAAEVKSGSVIYSGGAIRLADVNVLAKDEVVGGYPIDARFIQDPELRRDSAGAVLGETAGDAGVVRIDTMNIQGRWEILALVVKDA